ncbi:MAG: P63C domain-containing protein [Rhodospirillaceae bacterium]|nr:P63C domain-containing protein [Rhodospirillaceae bacterium]MDE0254702.1 P63C domain-containing protein [Rhodospirillaceae bacterium]MDE0616186.1 P63C domain-containing protein [Rhodospirillaceae bacterium]
MSKNKPLKVIADAQNHPLVIGGIEIECYVLEDETRVLSRGGFQAALGRHRTSRKHQSDDVVNLPAFLAAANLNPFIPKDLVTASTPIAFQAPSRGPVAYGFRAEILPAVCKVYVEARRAGALLPSQIHIAERAEILRDGLGLLGIIGLVDEATGYQKIRDDRVLAAILEKYIAKEWRPWTRTFPPEFYELIFSLKKWPGPDGVKRPSVIGRYTNDIVYDRLPDGVLDELRRKNPTVKPGQRRNRHHQWLTGDVGHPALREHLIGVMALMRAAPNWDAFKRALVRSYKKRHENVPLALGDDE